MGSAGGRISITESATSLLELDQDETNMRSETAGNQPYHTSLPLDLLKRSPLRVPPAKITAEASHPVLGHEKRREKLQRSDMIHQFTTTDALSRGNAPRDMLRPGMQNSLVEMLNVARYHPEHGETQPQPTAFRRHVQPMRVADATKRCMGPWIRPDKPDTASQCGRVRKPHRGKDHIHAVQKISQEEWNGCS